MVRLHVTDWHHEEFCEEPRRWRYVVPPRPHIVHASPDDRIHERCHMGCHRFRLPGYAYCAHHKCMHGDCPSPSRIDAGYCSRHTCRKTGCEEHVQTTDSYCLRHICRDEYCERQQDRASPYCIAHRCLRSNCPLPEFDGGFCFEHCRRYLPPRPRRRNRHHTTISFDV